MAEESLLDEGPDANPKLLVFCSLGAGMAATGALAMLSESKETSDRTS